MTPALCRGSNITMSISPWAGGIQNLPGAARGWIHSGGCRAGAPRAHIWGSEGGKRGEGMWLRSHCLSWSCATAGSAREECPPRGFLGGVWPLRSVLSHPTWI